MFCAKCGANVPDGAKFCDVCGQVMEAPAAPVVEAAPVAPVAAPAKKGNPMMLVIIAVVAVVAILLGCLLLGGNSYQGIVDDYYALCYEGDLSVLEDLAPEAFWTKAAGEYKITLDVLVDNPQYEALAQQAMNKNSAEIVKEYGADWELDLTAECDHDLSDAQIAAINVYFMEQLGVTVDDAKELHVRIDISSSLRDDIAYDEYILVKIDGDWYPVNGSFDTEDGVVKSFSGRFVIQSLLTSLIK